MSSQTIQSITLADLAAQASEGLNLGRGDGGGFVDPFQMALAYPIEILDQRVITNKRGLLELEVSVGIVQDDGSVRGAGRRWVKLPIFTAEKTAEGDPVALQDLKNKYGKRFHEFMRSVNPHTFNTFSKAEKKGKTWRFWDMDNEPMTAKEKNTREELIGKALIGVAEMFQQGTYTLQGSRLYYVRTENKQNAQFPYDNYFSDQPRKYPLAGVQ